MVDILYEQGPLLVLNKPPGLPTQAPPGIESLDVRLRAFLARRDAREGFIYLGLPHRLDRPASGAIAFTLNKRTARAISKQFQRRTVGKTYWALVGGRVMPAQGTWTDHLRKMHGQAQAEVVSPSHPEARIAVLHYRVLAHLELGTWLEIALETGRTHQIRIQAASRGSPVLGDLLYGSPLGFGPQLEDRRARAIALHARRLALVDPATKQPVEIVAPAPEPWWEVGLANE